MEGREERELAKGEKMDLELEKGEEDRERLRKGLAKKVAS